MSSVVTNVASLYSLLSSVHYLHSLQLDLFSSPVLMVCRVVISTVSLILC